MLEQMLDHHGFCELEIDVFFIGFITILEQLEEAISNSRRIRVAMGQAGLMLSGHLGGSAEQGKSKDDNT